MMIMLRLHNPKNIEIDIEKDIDTARLHLPPFFYKKLVSLSRE